MITGFAVDLGGTKTAAARIENGRVIAREQVLTDGQAGLDHQIAEMAALLKRLGHRNGERLGVAVAGRVDSEGRWQAVNADTLPEEVRAKGGKTYRSLQMDGREIEFSEGFTDLHTLSYAQIQEGRGFGLDAAAPSVEIVHEIRGARPIGLDGNHHRLAALPLAPHPFESSNISRYKNNAT